MLRRTHITLIVSPSLGKNNRRSPVSINNNNRSSSTSPPTAGNEQNLSEGKNRALPPQQQAPPLVRVKDARVRREYISLADHLSHSPEGGSRKSVDAESAFKDHTATSNSTQSAHADFSHLQPHELRLQQLLTAAFPIATVKFIGKQMRRVGTEADFLYSSTAIGGSSISEGGESRGVGGPTQGVSIATLGGKHDNSTPIRTLAEVIQRNQGGVLMSQYVSTTSGGESTLTGSSIPPWSSGSFLVDYARFCSIGPIRKSSSLSGDGDEVHHRMAGVGEGTTAATTAPAAESTLPPLYAPRLNPRRLALEAVVFLPGFHPSDLRKVVARNLIRHLPKLNPHLQASGSSAKQVKRGALSQGFMPSGGGEEEAPSSSKSGGSAIADGTAVQKKILDNAYLFDHYGMRILTDCIEMVVEADVPVYRCPDLSNPYTSRSSLEMTYVKQRRTMYVGFASPSWEVHPIRSGVDEEERHAVRVACGMSRETLRRSLPTPVLEAANILNTYAKEVCELANQRRQRGRGGGWTVDLSRKGGSSRGGGGGAAAFDSEAHDYLEDDEFKGHHGKGSGGSSSLVSQIGYLTPPSPTFWLNLVLSFSSRVKNTQCAILNEAVNNALKARSAPPRPSPWALAMEPSGTSSSSHADEVLFSRLAQDEEVQRKLQFNGELDVDGVSTPSSPQQQQQLQEEQSMSEDILEVMTSSEEESRHRPVPSQSMASLSDKFLEEARLSGVDRRQQQGNIEVHMKELFGMNCTEEVVQGGGEGAPSSFASSGGDEGNSVIPGTVSSAVLHPWRNLEWLRLRALTCPDTVEEALRGVGGKSERWSTSRNSKHRTTTTSSAANVASSRLRYWLDGTSVNHLRQIAALHRLRKRIQLRCDDDQRLRDSESLMMASLFSLSGYDFTKNMKKSKVVSADHDSTRKSADSPLCEDDDEPHIPIDAFATYAALVGRGNFYTGHDDVLAPEGIASTSSSSGRTGGDSSFATTGMWGGGADNKKNNAGEMMSQRSKDLARAMESFNTDHLILQSGSIAAPFDGPHHFNLITSERELRLMSASLADSLVNSVVRAAAVSEAHLISQAVQNNSMLPLEKFLSSTTELRAVLGAYVEVCRSFNRNPPNFLSRVSGELNQQDFNK